MGQRKWSSTDHQPTPSSCYSYAASRDKSDNTFCATAVPRTVMAEQVTNDVVKEAQSVGRPAPIDDTASSTHTRAADGAPPPGSNSTKLETTEAKPTITISNGAHAITSDHTSSVSESIDGEPLTASHQQKDNQTALGGNNHLVPNGDSGELSANESTTVADVSGGSDTDISRPGSVDQFKRDAGHARSNSSKKPSTFKSVSVTKNFLAKSAVAAPVLRSGDKTVPAVQSSNASLPNAKPRLVAKSGNSNTQRMLGQASNGNSGPDASKVWNKNQPVPPPPPKQFTDEELKQQYGIHLATRLQADEAGKEAKWADIDDDEEDWAPDTVQWMDGTKSSMAAAETRAAPVEQAKAIAKPEPAADVSSLSSTSITHETKPSVTGGVKTILKPGAHAQLALGKSSLVLKGQPEKPTLVAKPSATERRSPWAALPPIDKVSPVQINPPASQTNVQRFPPREPSSYESQGQGPAKEIAPDDFNRSWREERGGRPELFNSHSGRYEPVGEMRRGSIRDAGYRQQPSVLQRPSQEGPAEPSAAFQTSRSSADMPSWGRRRNSSNVSGDQARRMSFSRQMQDASRATLNSERRGSHSTSVFDPTDHDLSRQLPLGQSVSPQASQAHPVSPYGSAASSGQAQDLPTPNAMPAENPVEVQKRLMADKIERARLKKQQEQEAEKKAEAERKERLAKRLAAMGPLPGPKTKSKEQTSPGLMEQSPQSDKARPHTLQSPPKPPVPMADGEVAQYGMMKVHHAHPIKKTSPTQHMDMKPVETAPVHPHGESQLKSASSLNTVPVQGFDTLGREGEAPRQTPEQTSLAGHSLENTIAPGAKAQAAPPTWSQAPAPQPRPWTSQVWGPPPTKERALGNGTFDSGYARGQTRSSVQQPLPVQQPTTTTSMGLNLPSQAQPPPSAQQMLSQSGNMPKQAVTPPRPGPIAPPIAKGWGNFHDDIRKDDAKLVAKARQERELLGEAFRPDIRETYKDLRGQSQAKLQDKGNTSTGGLQENSIKKDELAKHSQDSPSTQSGPASSASLQQTSGPRASRFFPRQADIQPHVVSITSDKAESPPPPPETETHPAFSGDVGHPLVRLPKPSPRVRLPPAAIGTESQAESEANVPRNQPSVGARPLAMNPEWQARFNRLLEKPATTPVPAPASNHRIATPQPTLIPLRPGALAPAALSKATLDVRGTAGPATVSLPSSMPTKSQMLNQQSEMITRKGAEALFEDREFGSLPTVRLPKVAHLAANEAAVTAPKEDVSSRFKRMENPFTIRRLEAFDLEKQAQKIDVVIYIPTMRNAIVKTMPRKRRGVRTSGPYKPKQGDSTSGSTAGFSKERTRKSSGQMPADRSSGSSRPGNTSSWNKGGSTTPTQPTTWARRAAAPVH